MKSYILFISGTFDTHEEIEYFSLKVFGEGDIVNNIKLVIENLPNLTIVFDSDSDNQTIINRLPEFLPNEYIKYYFLFPLDSMTTYHLPEQLKDFMFKPNDYLPIVSIEKINNDLVESNLDEILEKIKIFGVESLTEKERDFLDNFDK